MKKKPEGLGRQNRTNTARTIIHTVKMIALKKKKNVLIKNTNNASSRKPLILLLILKEPL